MRIAILGNSGSGKSTLARWLVAKTNGAYLDLDNVAWEPDQIAVPRCETAAAQDVQLFCSSHTQWVVEGCYANLIQVALDLQPYLIFLNPGEAQCLAHCQARAWEPHKYASKEEQDHYLPMLLSWVSAYYTREGDMSLSGHRNCFVTYVGPKLELCSNNPSHLAGLIPQLNKELSLKERT